MDCSWTQSQYGSFESKNLVVEEAHGTYLVSDEGEEYLDINSGYWAAILGYSDPDLITTMVRASQRLSFCHNFEITHRSGFDLYQAIESAIGRSDFRLLWGCTGSDAVETALKYAFAFHSSKSTIAPRHQVLALRRAYHGSTLLSSSLGAFMKWPQGCCFSGLNVLRANPRPRDVADELTRLARVFRSSPPWAFIFEPIQAAGGVVEPQPDLLRGIVELCRNSGTVVIADEITTGMGRTGELFASQCLRPDIICLGKGLTAGYFPLSVCLIADWLISSESRENPPYGTTYGGHPVGCALAKRVLETVQTPECRERVLRIDAILRQALRQLTSYSEVDRVEGRGAMWGVTFTNKALAHRIADTLLKQRIYSVVEGRCLMILPAFTIQEHDLEHVCEVLEFALARESSGEATAPPHRPRVSLVLGGLDQR